MTSYAVRSRIPKDPWWHVAGLLFGLVFVLLLMAERLYPVHLNTIDRYVQAVLVPYQTFSHVEFFLAVTVLGSVLGITLTALGAAFLLRKNRFAVLQLFLLLIFASLSMSIAKLFVQRTRPDAVMWIDPLNSFSFPSGHATLSTALYGFFAVCLYRRITNRWVRAMTSTLCVLVIALVCFSRLVLDVHYFTDVLAGIFLGLFWLAVIFMLPQHLRRYPQKKP